MCLLSKIETCKIKYFIVTHIWVFQGFHQKLVMLIFPFFSYRYISIFWRLVSILSNQYFFLFKWILGPFRNTYFYVKSIVEFFLNANYLHEKNVENFFTFFFVRDQLIIVRRFFGNRLNRLLENWFFSIFWNSISINRSY